MAHCILAASTAVAAMAAVAGLSSQALAQAPRATELFGLVIGYNGSSRPDRPPLRYADDDAVKNGQLLRDLGATHVVLTELDSTSQRLYPSVAPLPPTKQTVRKALEALNRDIAKVRRQGRGASLLLFFSGHGDVENDEGYIELKGSRLTRAEFHALLQGCDADIVHVVVDACKSYFLIFGRGPGGKRRGVTSHFLPPDERLPDNVGLLLSASAAQDSHEWEAYQAGIFSHEVRSALRGSADLDASGAISYDEVAAFVHTANGAIANPMYRPAFFVRAPARSGGGGDIVSLDQGGRASRLLVGPDYEQHIYVEDSHGHRIADLHPHAALSMEVLLPANRPLFVHEVATRTEYLVERTGLATLAELPRRRAVSQQRGARHVAFSSLFSQPLGPTAIAGYKHYEAQQARLRERELKLIARMNDPTRWMRPTLGLTSVGVAAVGGLMTAAAVSARRDVDRGTPNRTRIDVNQRIDLFNRGAVTAYVAAAVGLSVYLLWRYLDEDDDEKQPPEPGLHEASVQ